MVIQILNSKLGITFQTRNYITCFGHICNHRHKLIYQQDLWSNMLFLQLIMS